MLFRSVVSLGQKEKYVFYRDSEQKEKYQDYKDKIDKIQEDVINELENLKKLISKLKLNTDIVYNLLLNLRYLVKHAAFKEEQECRIILIRKLNDKEKVKSNDSNHLYVDYVTLDETNVSEICFAPKANDIDKFKQHLARNNYSVKCYKSKSPWA